MEITGKAAECSEWQHTAQSEDGEVVRYEDNCLS